MLKFLIPVAAILIVIVLFVRQNLNHRDVIRYEMARSVSGLSDADLRQTNRPGAPQGPALPDTVTPLPRDRSSEYVIAPVACRTADTAGHELLVGIRLVFEKGPLEKEVRSKENNIIHLLKFVFSNKIPSKIEAEPVRREIKDRINAFLSTGKIHDVIFTSLNIIPPRIAP